MDSLVCEQCGGSNIQILAWVDANTNEYKGESGDHDRDVRWCEDCEEHVDFITAEEFLEKEGEI